MNWIERLHGDVSEYPTLAEVERELIIEVLRKTGVNCTRAAEILGLDRRTLYRKLEAWQARVVTERFIETCDGAPVTITRRSLVLPGVASLETPAEVSL